MFFVDRVPGLAGYLRLSLVHKCHCLHSETGRNRREDQGRDTGDNEWWRLGSPLRGHPWGLQPSGPRMASNDSYHPLKTKLVPLWRWFNFLKLKLIPECKNYILWNISALEKYAPKHSFVKIRWRYVPQRSRVICHHCGLEMLAHIPNKEQTVLDLALHLSGHWSPWLPALMLDHSSLWTLPSYRKRSGQALGIQSEWGKRDYVSKEGQDHGGEIYRDSWPKIVGTHEL